MPKRYHCFHIMQYEVNPKTGEKLIDEAQIRKGVSHKTITKWAYICHDRDVYSVDDESPEKPWVHSGEPKPRHWHIVCYCINAISVEMMAGFFKVPEQFVEIKSDRSAFVIALRYLTHESDRQQALGKALYSDAEITNSPNFDYREEIDKYEADLVKYGMEVSKRTRYEYAVAFEGMTLLQVVQEDRLAYLDNIDRLKKLRLDYIEKFLPMPPFRVNFYVEGEGRTGKSLLSRAIARTYADPHNEAKDDDEVFFETSLNGKVLFDGYDGQPAIIWDEGRADLLLKNLGGLSGVLDTLDLAPSKKLHNIKFGHVRLKNTFNIINSTQPFEDWCAELCGTITDPLTGEKVFKEDPSQIYGRVPVDWVVNTDNFTIRCCKGFFQGTREYEQYLDLKTYQGSFKKLVEACGGEKSEAYRAISRRMIESSMGETENEIEQILSHPQTKSSAELWDEFLPGEPNPFNQMSFLNENDVALLQELDGVASPFDNDKEKSGS